MISWLQGIDARYARALEEAEACDTPIDAARIPQDYATMSSYLFSILIGVLKDEAAEGILSMTEMNGFEAWRALSVEARRREHGQRLTTSQTLTQPSFGDAATWRRGWLKWEQEVAQHRAATGVALPDDIRINIVREAAPAELAAH